MKKREKKSLRESGAIPKRNRQIKRISQIEDVTLESAITNAHQEQSLAARSKDLIELSVEDQKLFAQSLINLPKANLALADAIKRYKASREKTKINSKRSA